MGPVECSVIEPDIRPAVPVQTSGLTCSIIATEQVEWDEGWYDNDQQAGKDSEKSANISKEEESV